MTKQVFYDPESKRWRRLRLFTDPLGVIVTLLIVFFAFTLSRSPKMADFSLPSLHRPLRTLKERRHRAPRRMVQRRKKRPSEIPLNSGQGIRAAYYVPWDEGSFPALQEHYTQIDLLFPEWLHVITTDGRLQALAPENKLFDVVQAGVVHSPDPQHPVMQFLKQEHAQTEVFPLINNFDPVSNQWLTSIGDLLNSAANRAALRARLMAFLASDNYHGISLDFEEIPVKAQPGFQQLLAELSSDLHARGMKLYVNLPPDDNDYNYKKIAAETDGIILMNYDQHVPGTPPGPIAAQDWFVNNLELALKSIPRNKIISALGNYGYDWPTGKNSVTMCGQDQVCTVSVQEAWLNAQQSDSSVTFESDSLNPHYGYIDEHNVHHEVWFLDAATVLNQMRAARQLGINTFALWRLGAEDASLWNIWDQPGAADAPQKLQSVPPGHDVDIEGHGEIITIAQNPEWGWRTITTDAESGLVTDEVFTQVPTPYQLDEYGWSPNKFAITFDDGPDPTWTPKILDVLQREHATATFFLIGEEADKFPGLMQREIAEGNEIGNHTFTHPNITDTNGTFMKFEMNSTERLFEAKLGFKPLFFRPPYAIDEEPDTAEQVAPLRDVQNMGYYTIGSKIDPRDWQLIDPTTGQHRTADDMVASALAQATQMQFNCTKLPCGNVVLLHDGGGDRSATVAALPRIIEGLRAHGYQIVPLSELIGKPRDEVMVPITANERWSAMVDLFGFDVYGGLYQAIVIIFFLGNVLMTLRLLIIGGLALYDRVRTPKVAPIPWSELPPVAVLVPAYNEEKVIASTVRAVLTSQYPADRLRVLVIDDGSRDATIAVTEAAFPEEIRSGRLRVLCKANGGKAEGLNLGLTQVTEEIFIGIDADTVIAPNAISLLVAHFADPRIGAVAGNTKVGNRVNLWTRWQALEYITSQNFERRALDALGAVTVVPGAIGAWRTATVRTLHGYNPNTVAEDADLTMSLLQSGYRVVYEDRALAFTEAPINANGLMRQRFRWSFGILQSVWKHRSAFRRKGALGWFALPNIAIFQILLPVVSPAIDFMFVFGALSYAVDRYFHPITANPASVEKLGLFFLIFMVTDFIASCLAFALERRATELQHEEAVAHAAPAASAAAPAHAPHVASPRAVYNEDPWLLGQVWLQRFAYRQLFSVVLFKTLKRAIDGRPFSWDKLERTAAVPQAAAASAET